MADGSIATEPVLQEALAAAKEEGRRLHFMGLVSRGGVHSHATTCMPCSASPPMPTCPMWWCMRSRMADTAAQAGAGYLEELEAVCEETGAGLATVCGRYWAMDRDKRWERIAKAYALLVNGQGEAFPDAQSAMAAAYGADITDEFVEPAVLEGVDGRIRPGDVVFCFNFRTDRCRQITTALTQEDFLDHGMSTLALHYVTMTNYDDRFHVEVLYDKPNLPMTMGEVVSAAGTQLRLAETEKYPHVTFFFSEGAKEFPGRIPGVAPCARWRPTTCSRR